MINYDSFHSLKELNEWAEENPGFEIINIESSEEYYYWIRVWYKS